MPRKFIDLTGKTFGRLTVVRRESPEGGRHVIWQCLCQCGNYASVSTGNLLNRSVVSCGCYKQEYLKRKQGKKPANKLRNNLTGKTFGKLKVIKLAEISNPRCARHVYWECKCACGSLVIVRSSSLTAGKSRSCGCSRIKKEKNNGPTDQPTA